MEGEEKDGAFHRKAIIMHDWQMKSELTFEDADDSSLENH